MQRAQILLEEYRQVNENMRHYADMRFKQLTLFYVINAALVTGFITVTIRKDAIEITGISQPIFTFLGISIIVLFALIGERISDYWHRFRSRAQEIESILGLRQHRDAPIGKRFTAATATRFLYVVFLIFWAWLLVKGWGFLIIVAPFIAFLVCRYISVEKRYPIKRRNQKRAK